MLHDHLQEYVVYNSIEEKDIEKERESMKKMKDYLKE